MAESIQPLKTVSGCTSALAGLFLGSRQVNVSSKQVFAVSYEIWKGLKRKPRRHEHSVAQRSCPLPDLSPASVLCVNG